MTSVSDMLSADRIAAEKLAGALFALELDVQGLPEPLFDLRRLADTR